MHWVDQDKPPLVGLTRPDELSDSVTTLSYAIIAEIADLLQKVRSGKASWDVVRLKLGELSKLQRDSAVAGWLLGLISAWSKKTVPVPKGHGVTPPTLTKAESADLGYCGCNMRGVVDLAASNAVRGFWYGVYPLDPNALRQPGDMRSSQFIGTKTITAREAATLRKQYASWEFSTDAGKRRAFAALSNARVDNVVIAIDKASNAMVGVVSYGDDANLGRLNVTKIGTDGTVKGTGTRLMDDVLQDAHRSGKGIAVQTDGDNGFLQKYGLVREAFDTFAVDAESVSMLVAKKAVERRVGKVFTVLEEASDWLTNRGLASMEDYRNTAAKYAVNPAWNTDQVLGDLNRAVLDSLRTGESLDGFRERIADTLKAPASSVETIYRTQTKRAYTEGQDRIASNPKMSKYFGYWLYMATHDPRTREHHLALDSKVFRADDADAMAYINSVLAEFNCRCTKIAVGISEAKQYGLYTIRNNAPVRISLPPDDDERKAA